MKNDLLTVSFNFASRVLLFIFQPTTKIVYHKYKLKLENVKKKAHIHIAQNKIASEHANRDNNDWRHENDRISFIA